MNGFILALGMFLGGGLLGYSIRAVLFIIRKNSLELSVTERLLDARKNAQNIIDEARVEADKSFDKLKATEERLVSKESLLDARALELDERALSIEEKSTAATELKAQAEQLVAMRIEALESIAGINKETAYTLLLADLEQTHAQDLETRIYKLESFSTETVELRARDILATAIQRLATATTNELATTTIAISDDVKGKIIGREGRNIRTFERFSGVELLVDEAPGSIVVSSFDPIRRAIASHALDALIKDGRIQPAKIEEELEKSRIAINDIIKEKGSAAVYELGIASLDPRVVAILGRLHFRTSYGQNVLQHSIEMAHLAEMIASEIGADPYIAKAGALVHDIGKALDHEFEGTHVDIGIKVLRKFATDERIITAMKSHHDDCPHESLEAVIVQTADIISGARPGARKDTAERYLKRLGELEVLASKFNGVERAYALQAGREIRIFVHPENVSDFEARDMARAIALSIETELRYPGQIKVTIIREIRITDYAR